MVRRVQRKDAPVTRYPSSLVLCPIPYSDQEKKKDINLTAPSIGQIAHRLHLFHHLPLPSKNPGSGSAPSVQYMRMAAARCELPSIRGLPAAFASRATARRCRRRIWILLSIGKKLRQASANSHISQAILHSFSHLWRIHRPRLSGAARLHGLHFSKQAVLARFYHVRFIFLKFLARRFIPAKGEARSLRWRRSLLGGKRPQQQ